MKPPSPSDVRVVVVDDHPAVREGLRAMLDADPGLHPVAATATAREAAVLVRGSRPALMLIDYHLPDENGVSLCLRLKTAGCAGRALIYSAFADDQLAILATIAGADALMSKAADPDELCSVARALAGGEPRPFSISPAALDAAAARLDPADLPILGMLAHCTPPGEIAETLRMSETWLVTRRWAMLERLMGRPARRVPPHRRIVDGQRIGA